MTEQIIDICLCEMSPARKIAGVPAFVCPRCDERMYSGEVSIKLGDIRDRFDSPDNDGVEFMLVYQYDRPTLGHIQITLGSDDAQRIRSVTTISATDSLMGHGTNVQTVQTEAPARAYAGTADFTSDAP